MAGEYGYGPGQYQSYGELREYPPRPGIQEFQEALYRNSSGMYHSRLPHTNTYAEFQKFQQNVPAFSYSNVPFPSMANLDQYRLRAEKMDAVPMDLRYQKTNTNSVSSMPRTESGLNYMPPQMPETEHMPDYESQSFSGTKHVSHYVSRSHPGPQNVQSYVPLTFSGTKSVQSNVPQSFSRTKGAQSCMPKSLPRITTVSSSLTALTVTPPTSTLSMVTRTVPTWSDRYKVHRDPLENVPNIGIQNKELVQNQCQMPYAVGQVKDTSKRLSPPLPAGNAPFKSPNGDKVHEVINGRVTPTDLGQRDMRRSSLSPLFGPEQADMAIVDSVLYNMARGSAPGNQSQTVDTYSYPVVCCSAGAGHKMSSVGYGTGKVPGAGSYLGDVSGPQTHGPAQVNSHISPRQNLVNSRYGAMVQLSQLSDVQNITPPKSGNSSLNTSDISIPADYENVEIRLLSSPDMLGALNTSTSSDQVTSTHETQPERPRKRQRSSSGSCDEPKPKNRPLPQHAVDIMLKWYEQHVDDPYPSRKDVQEMADAGGIAYGQARSWFANKRNRNKNTRITNYRKKFKNELSSICREWVKDGAVGTPDTKKVVDRIIGLIAENSGKRQKNPISDLSGSLLA